MKAIVNIRRLLLIRFSLKSLLLKAAVKLALIAVFAVAFGEVSFAGPEATGPSLIQDSIQGAPLIVRNNAVSIVGTDNRDASEGDVLLLLEPSMTSVSVKEALDQAIETKSMDIEEAMRVDLELRGLTGARYEIPSSRKKILASLGFPENAEVLATNWMEMAAVHMETLMSVSSPVSRFLLKAMGIQAREEKPAEKQPETNAETRPEVQPEAPLEKPPEASVEESSSASLGATVRESAPVVVEADGNAFGAKVGLEGRHFVSEPALK